MDNNTFSPKSGCVGANMNPVCLSMATSWFRCICPRSGILSLGFAVVLVCALAPACAGKTTNDVAEKASPALPKIFREVSTVAKGLRGPDGIAVDPETGNVYVSEENAATIVCIKPNGAKQVVLDSSTPVYEKRGTSRKIAPGLRSPEGVALGGKGILYVVEDIPGGRLISFNLMEKERNPHPVGTVVPIPIENSRFAWESVDVGPAGELLVAGSTMEAVAYDGRNEGPLSLFRGTILYRDAQGGWWMPLNDSMTSYSAACFSADGNYAFFACEFSGDVGCLDLRTHNVRTFRSKKIFHSPEGLCVLPGGSALVVEEAGKIYRLDPTTDTLQLLFDNQGTIESALWDAARGRLLVTDDQHGLLLSLELKQGLSFRSSIGTIQDILFEDQSTLVEMIPDQCPGYLAKVLKLGGYDPRKEGAAVTFHQFAEKYCLVAIDAEASLLTPDSAIEDPIKRIQFVIVAPYLIGVKEGELIWSSSGFTAVKKSGQNLKTELVQRQVIHGDLMESRFTPVGGQTIALPMPFSARINSDGFVSVNFMGMGVMPDFFLELNSVDPDQSVMVVMYPNDKPQQYALKLPCNRNSSHWVIALERKDPDVWRNLSGKR